MAQLVRDSLEQRLSQEKARDSSGKTVLRRLYESAVTGGPKDLSKNIDHYLYGAPKK